MMAMMAFVFWPSLSDAMGERPEEPWKAAARETQRISSLLQDQIAKCDPWSKLDFEVNGVILRPLAIVSHNLRLADPTKLPVNICNERVSLRGFGIGIPYPDYIDPRFDRTEKQSRITNFRKWWVEQYIPEYMTVSVPHPQSSTSVESYNRIKERFETEFPEHRRDTVAEPRLVLPSPYSAWFAPIGGSVYYLIKNGAVPFEVFSCPHRLFKPYGLHAMICDFGSLFWSGKLTVSFRIHVVPGAAKEFPLLYNESLSSLTVVSAHDYLRSIIEN